MCSIIDKPYSTSFGFTEEEVAAIIEPDRLEEARSWYDGYILGEHVIYNPWSILHYITEGLLKDAAQQVRDRQYAAELLAARAMPVYQCVIVFDGKKSWVKRVDDVLAPATT